jgi:hypothetical protein
VLQIILSSDTLNERQLYDFEYYKLRQQLAPFHGVTFPTPAGGKYPSVGIHGPRSRLRANGDRL